MAAASPAKWDLEVDLVVVGSGSARPRRRSWRTTRGSRCAMLEKAPKLGGLSALRRRRGLRARQPAHGEARPRGLARRRAAHTSSSSRWATAASRTATSGSPRCTRPSSTTRTKAGVRWKACQGLPDYYYPDAPGSKASGRYLSVELFDGKTLGEWQPKTFLTPIMPMGALHEEMYEWGGLAKVTSWNFELLGQRIVDDQRTFGPGMMGFFVKAAVIDRKIPAFVETPVRELVDRERPRDRRARGASGRQRLLRARAKGVSSRSAATTTTRTWRACSRTCPTGTACSRPTSTATTS